MTEKLINGIKIYHHNVLGSTNLEAKSAVDAPHLSAVVADMQNSGRGRLGRSFFSPDGGLYASFILDPERISCGLPFCTAAAALAVFEVLAELGIGGLSVKWVNDILQNGKKVCGILTEARTLNGAIDRIVVGVGINLTKPKGGFPEDIRDRASAVGFTGDRLALAASIALALEKYIQMSPDSIAKLYSSHLALIGKRATVTDYANGQKKLTGTILGVDENCFLRLLGDGGEVITVSSGEISYQSPD